MWQSISINMPRVVSADENNLLTSTINPQETKDAFFQIDPSKAPGRNGCGACFSRNIGSLLEMLL